MKRLLLLSFFLHVPFIFSFHADTYIQTPAGSIPISDVKPQDVVITHQGAHNITALRTYNATKIIKISCADQTIITHAAQRFYLSSLDTWKRADELCVGDELTTDGQGIQAIELIQEPKNLYCLSIQTDHTFIIEPGIIVHNTDPATPVVVIALTWAFGEGVVEFIGATFAFGIFGTLFGVEMSKKKNRQKYDVRPICKVDGVSVGGSPNPEDPEKNRKRYPHGMYHDSDAHKTYVSGRKSPRPSNGQEALNNSIAVKNSAHRVAISDSKFVVLRETCPGLYHGYTCSWKELPWQLQNALKDAKLVNHRGNFL